jgi:uncharacterized membrane protein YhhN
MFAWATLTAICVLGLLVAERRESRAGALLTKPLASLGFLGVALSGGALDSAYGTAVLCALALSWVGDVLLISPRKAPFLGGLAAFLGGHVAYCVAFGLTGPSPLAATLAAAALLVPGLLIARWLLPHVDADMRTPVIAYMVVITVMVALAVGTVAGGGTWLIAVGAVAFYASDISVAIDRFVKRAFVNRLWGLPLYYAAQLLLAWSVAT